MQNIADKALTERVTEVTLFSHIPLTCVYTCTRAPAPEEEIPQ